MKLDRAKKIFIAVALGGIPLVTSGSCDPYSGAFDFFRDDDDGYYYDDYYYDDYYYDEPLFCDEFGCY